MQATEAIPWIGNVIIAIGLWKVGDKSRNAFLFTMVGEICYGIHTFLTGDWAIFVAVLIFFSLAVRNYIKWSHTDRESELGRMLRNYVPASTAAPTSEMVFHRRW